MADTGNTGGQSARSADDEPGIEALRLLEPDPALSMDWVVGLAMNSAAPHSVLRRVFTVDSLPDMPYWLCYRKLSPQLAAAGVAHGSPEVRRILAENPFLPLEERTVLTGDPDPRVRRMAVMMACEYDVELPLEVTVRLATGPEARLRYHALALPGLPEEIRLALAEDPDPRVRAAAIARSWDRLRPEVRAAARADPDPRVREAVERATRATRAERPLPTTVEGFLAEEDDRRRHDAASEAPVDAALAQLLATHEDSWIRRAAARNPHLPTALALPLTADPDDSVRLAVSLRGDLTEEQRAAIDYTVPEGRQEVPVWVRERFGDPDALREIAGSSHVVLRRAVTCARELPADVIERLAADDDYYLKLMLCENDHAPHELLLEMFTSWRGLSCGTLAFRRNFARPGLARFADDPDQWLRYAALFDPEGGPELVERLSHDQTDLVRRHAVADPRLPCPRLIELLGKDGMPRVAASNPSLPVPVMHRLLDLAGVDR